MIYGFGMGLPLSIIGLFFKYSFDWHWKYVQFIGRIPNDLATPLIAFGYVGGIMLWIRNGIFNNLKENLRSIGKTALTAYLLFVVNFTHEL